MPGPTLYARYVPPKAVASAAVNNAEKKNAETNEQVASTASPSLKRKREEPVGRKERKRKSDKENIETHSNVIGSLVLDQESQIISDDQGNVTVPAKPKTKSKSKNTESAKAPDEASEIVTESEEHVDQNRKTKKKEKWKKQSADSSNKDNEEAEDDEHTVRHAGVFSKFQKALDKAANKTTDNEDVDMDAVEEGPELHDLVPIPMPAQPPVPEAFSALAALPPWLSNPVKIPKDTNMPFADILDIDVAKQLESKGFAKALSVQAGVLPLLLPTSNQHPGDLCVSAATGSGKTLAYMLPIIESLEKQKLVSRELRALIVVPTRELVTQVRETAEMCALGTGLHVGTAVGHHTFKNEQSSLVKQGQIYDPAGHELLRQKAENVDELDVLENDDSEQFYNLLPYHVPEYTSNVDILICTPGRLVEHIKSTKGFTLQQLQWFVIDEADRLLDQSFQEWVEVLQTAMSSQSNKYTPGKPFRPVFLSPHLGLRPDGWVRKVVLSATLTRDLQKLGSLNLRNPKLVLVEEATVEQAGGEEIKKDSASGNFTLPPTLQEFGAPVGDGSQKPLYLLKLLQQIFGDAPAVRIKASSKGGTLAKDIESSDEDESSSSESSSDSGSDDDDNDSVSSLLEDISDTASTTSSSSISSSSSSSSSTTANDSSPTSPHPTPHTTIHPPPSKPSTTPNALIFTSSNESATRLDHLLTHLSPTHSPHLALLTKSGTSASTRRTLTAFTSGHLRILIATDRASRGLDLPNLRNVINYDIPHSVTSYVHRVGRTARAGKEGRAWTLVAEREAAWFWNVIARGKGNVKGSRVGEDEGIERGAGRGVERVRLEVDVDGEGGKRYEEALENLRRDVER